MSFLTNSITSLTIVSMIDVTENQDGTFTISWDENDPKESILNYWTEQDFINALTNYINSLKESGVLDNDREEKLTESIEAISEFFIDQTAEEVEQDINTVHEFWEEYNNNCAEVKDPDQIYDNYIQATNQETYGDQGTEQS